MNFTIQSLLRISKCFGVSSTLLLAACATQQPLVSDETIEEKAQTEPEIVYKNFEPETFYSLMVAELAGDRQRYDIALRNYVQQAHQTRDKAVAARATRIARFLGARQVTLNSSLLWLELEPNNEEAQVIAATELAQAGRLSESIKLAKNLSEKDVDSLFLSIASRAEQSTDTQREGLIKEYTELLEIHPEKPELIIGKGLLLAQSGSVDEALKLAQGVLKDDPMNVPAAKLETNILRELERNDEAKARLSSMLEQDPRNLSLRLHYARLLTHDDIEGSKEQFEILNEQKPGDPDLMFSLALLNQELGLFDEAKALYSELIHTPNRGSSAHFYLGEIANAQGDTETALVHYQQVGAGQDFMLAINRASDILLSQNRLEDFGDQFNKLRRDFPQQEERLYLSQSNLLVRHAMLEEAVNILTEGLTFHTQSSSLLYARAMANEQRDLIHLTEEDLRTILNYDTTNATALNALGYTLADRTDRFEEAFELISEAFALNPDDPAIIDSMGWVHYRLGNYQQAITHLREAMKAFPDHEIAAHLGEVLWVVGEKQEAEAIWQEGLRLNPDSDIIPGVIERLKAEQ
ncbi:tetratricopeptide repeat protein [Sessilibacter corallicola]|uniref:tetratricopeptide repeat protein n=1 Tax=Sessilibacter corallicola TaxID=2904075 RepID=UPI003341858B